MAEANNPYVMEEVSINGIRYMFFASTLLTKRQVSIREAMDSAIRSASARFNIALWFAKLEFREGFFFQSSLYQRRRE